MISYSKRKGQNLCRSQVTTVKAPAFAKINLTLHVTGQRGDGYHLLHSLVVFADLADQVAVTTAPRGLQLSCTGQFALGVPTDEKNLAMQAAAVFAYARDVELGATIAIEKMLPHAAGIGSASADAAAVLRMMPTVWNVPELEANSPDILALGADVPVCMHAPKPAIMSGIGENVQDAPRLPPCAMVLVNPRVEVPTKEVFERLKQKTNAPMSAPPSFGSLQDFCTWLSQQRNDLEQPACEIAPEISRALTMLRRMPAVGWAGMSGSGATCVALVKDMGAARQVARAIQVQEMSWWVAPTPMLG